MALDNQNCDPYFDQCDDNAGITLDQLFKFMIRKDANGCPVFPITGNIVVDVQPAPAVNNIAEDTITRPNTNTDGTYFHYGLLGQRPTFSDNSGLARALQITDTNDEIVYLKGGTFSIDGINPKVQLGAKIHFFKSQIVMPNDGLSFSPSFAQLNHYLGSFDLEVLGETATSAYGKLSIDRDDFPLIPKALSKSIYYIIEVNDSLEVQGSGSISIRLVTQRPC